MKVGEGGGRAEQIAGAPEIRKGSRYVTYVFLFLGSIFVYWMNEPFHTKPKSTCNWQFVIPI